ncbi:MAG TPA: ABC transporter permease [Candidatus Acidoferrum sp.]|jgi:predicted permease
MHELLKNSWLRAKAIWKREELDRDLDDELAFHLSKREEKNRAAGLPVVEARYAAHRQFGNATRIKERNREMWTFTTLETLWQDLRYGTRTLRNNPGFTAAAVLAIALGIGINVGIFSIFNGVALRLLPIPGAEHLVTIDQVFHGKHHRNVQGEPTLFSYSEYLEYRDHNHVMSGLLAVYPFLNPMTLAGTNPQQVYGQLTSCNYFDVLQERPVQGRTFVESDCSAPGAGAEVVLSNDLWRTAFGADPSVIGKRVVLNRVALTVVGVAPVGFGGTEPVASSFWIPLTMQKSLVRDIDLLSDDNVSWLALLGRVRPGVSIDQVHADLGVLAARIDHLHGDRTEPTSLTIRTATFLGRPEEHLDTLAIGSVILIAFGLVLLIAGANVANLLLARASARHKEISLRLAIGASRWRLIRQLLTESLLLSLIGGALGSLLAFWSVTAIYRFALSHLPKDFPQLVFNVTPDFHALGYALILTLVAGVAFGLAPALHASRQDLNSSLKQETSGPGGTARGGGSLRGMLVGTQIAVCMVLLVAAGLLLHGLYFAQTADPGFAMKNIAVVSIDFVDQGYSPEQAAAFQQQLIERTSAMPGVDAVVEAQHTPLGGAHNISNYEIPGHPGDENIEWNKVSPGYFSVLDMPQVRGRDFTAAEARSSASVAILTESTARKFWPGEDPIGKTIKHPGESDRTVIGIVRDAQVSQLGQSTGSYLYVPLGPRDHSSVHLLVRSAGTFPATANGIRAGAKSLDPDLPVMVSKLEDNLEFSRTGSRIAAALSGGLGALALLLAAIGVYGVVSYAVNRRVREIGIRMTLGADGRNVMGLLMRQALRPAFIGALVGVSISAAVSRVLSSALFGVSAYDPVTFICVPVFLLGIASIASYIPARRATGVDPITALRYE